MESDYLDIEIVPYYYETDFFDSFEETTGFTEWDLPLLINATRDGDRVLDVGCGNGRATLALARQTGASHVVGIDTSQRALSRLQDAMVTDSDLRERVTAVHGSVLETEVDSTGPFDLVVLADCTINFFNTEGAAMQVLQRSADLLHEHGRLALAVFDDGAPDSLGHLDGRITAVPYRHHDGLTYVLWWSMTYDLSESLLHRTVFVQSPDGSGRAMVSDMYDRLWTPSMLAPLLEDAGFVISGRSPAEVANGAATGVSTTLLTAERVRPGSGLSAVQPPASPATGTSNLGAGPSSHPT